MTVCTNLVATRGNIVVFADDKKRGASLTKQKISLGSLAAAGREVTDIPPLFGLTESEFDRYVDIGLIKIRSVEAAADDVQSCHFTIMLGNKVLSVAFEGRHLAHREMRFLRGKKSEGSK